MVLNIIHIIIMIMHRRSGLGLGIIVIRLLEVVGLWLLMECRRLNMRRAIIGLWGRSRVDTLRRAMMWADIISKS